MSKSLSLEVVSPISQSEIVSAQISLIEHAVPGPGSWVATLVKHDKVIIWGQD